MLRHASLGYLFLLWCFAAVLAAPGAPAEPIQDDEADPMVAAMKKLLMAQSEIIYINKETLKPVSAQSLDARITAVEEDVKKLTPLAAIQRTANNSCDVALQLLTLQYKSINEQLKKLQAIVQERTQEDEKKQLIRDIVLAVKNNYLKLAQEKLVQLDDFVQIPNIVHEIYANSESNFEPIVHLARVLSNITASYEVLRSLNQEMNANHHQDPYKLVVLAEAFESEVIKQHSDPDKVKTFALNIINDLADKIETNAAEVLIRSVSSSEYQNSTEIQAVIRALNNFRPDLSDEVMQRLVDALYQKAEINKVLEYLFTRTTTSQAAFGFQALFWKLKDDGRLNDKVTLKLASLLSQLQKRPQYASVSESRKEAVNKVVNLLPDCARNLFFSPAVCFWNKGRMTYMEASNESYAYDKERRNIFTLAPTEDTFSGARIPFGAPWEVHQIGDKILFRNKNYPREYLYVAYLFYNPKLRYVFSWIPGSNTDDQSAFAIELEGNYCYLKSIVFNQYLFASEVGYWFGGTYSYVFTWNEMLPDDKSSFLWQIRGC